jgi:hypothetical protein
MHAMSNQRYRFRFEKAALAQQVYQTLGNRNTVIRTLSLTTPIGRLYYESRW